MSRGKRAAQFAAFDALKGLREALAQKERLPEPKRILAEDGAAEINAALLALQPGQLATVVYYGGYEQSYQQLTGPVRKIDGFWKTCQIGDVLIDFSEIAELHPL